MAHSSTLKAVVLAIKAVEANQVDHPELGIQERVVCYELYHKLRAMEDAGSILVLPARVQAELNKTAQHRFRDILRKLCRLQGEELDWAVKESMPDLLIHDPGTDSHNRLVMEVKLAHARSQAIKWDLAKLALFRGDILQYEEAVFLIINAYGEDPDDTLRMVQKMGTGDGPVIQIVSFDVQGKRLRSGEARFAIGAAHLLFEEAGRKRDEAKRNKAKQGAKF